MRQAVRSLENIRFNAVAYITSHVVEPMAIRQAYLIETQFPIVTAQKVCRPIIRYHTPPPENMVEMLM